MDMAWRRSLASQRRVSTDRSDMEIPPDIKNKQTLMRQFMRRGRVCAQHMGVREKRHNDESFFSEKYQRDFLYGKRMNYVKSRGWDSGRIRFDFGCILLRERISG
jgi:hypothetical protein